jgi:hypothetical protein
MYRVLARGLAIDQRQHLSFLDDAVEVGVQAGASGTTAKGADGTVDQTAALTFTYKF